jgi:hypothetical protein
MTVRLSEIAHGRSGDKGNHANVAIIAYTPQGFQWLRDHLTQDVVGRYFESLGSSRIIRYEAANVLAFNFMLYDVLAGGASLSMRRQNAGPGIVANGNRNPRQSCRDDTSFGDEVRRTVTICP